MKPLIRFSLSLVVAAVACAADVVGDEPFHVMLPDEIMGDSSLLLGLGAVVEATGVSAVALKQVPLADTSRYGIVDVVGPARPVAGVEVVPFGAVVEKPASNPPSDLAVIGRYSFTPDVYPDLAALAPASMGEIQLSDALTVQAQRRPLNGVLSTITRHDIGHPLGWLQAVVEAGLAHPDLGDEFGAWLRAR